MISLPPRRLGLTGEEPLDRFLLPFPYHRSSLSVYT